MMWRLLRVGPGFAMLRAMRLRLLLLLALLAFATGCSGDDASAEGAATMEAAATDAVDFYCPMHPEVRASAEGTCPKCKMALVKEGDEASHGAAAPEAAPEADAAADAVYTCPMHPEVSESAEGRCPTCNMFLVKEEAEAPAEEPAAHDHSEH